MTYRNCNIFLPLRLLYFAIEVPRMDEQLPVPGGSGEKTSSYPVDEARSELMGSRDAKPFSNLDDSAPSRTEQIAAKIVPGPETQDKFLEQIDTDFDPDTEIRPVVLNILETIEQGLTFDPISIDTESSSFSAAYTVDLGDATEIAADASFTAYDYQGTNLEENHLLGLTVTQDVGPRSVTTLGLRSEFQLTGGKLYVTGLYATADFSNDTSVGVGAASSTEYLDAVSLYVARGGFSGSFAVEPRTGEFTGEIAYSIEF